MRTFQCCAAAILLSALCAAQEGRGPATADAVVAQLDAELQQATAAHQAAVQKVRSSDAYQQAKGDRKAQGELLATVAPVDVAALTARAVDAAEQAQGDERVTLLAWAATHTRDRALIEDVVARIEQDHIGSPKLVVLMEQAMSLSRTLGAERSAALLQKVVAESKHGLTRAWALYWMAQSLQRGRDVSAEDRQKAQDLLAQAEKLAEGTELADKIAGPRFKAERLQIGMVAPDIVGEDLDGVAFQLSDYRGKVVVLDFWGFW